jgi:hypothetical protein
MELQVSLPYEWEMQQVHGWMSVIVGVSAIVVYGHLFFMLKLTLSLLCVFVSIADYIAFVVNDSENSEEEKT